MSFVEAPSLSAANPLVVSSVLRLATVLIPGVGLRLPLTDNKVM